MKEMDFVNEFKHVIKTWKPLFVPTQILQDLFTKYWTFVVGKK